MTTVISVSETRAQIGRQARLKTWFPARTVAALVSPFTSMYNSQLQYLPILDQKQRVHFHLVFIPHWREIYIIFIHFYIRLIH